MADMKEVPAHISAISCVPHSYPTFFYTVQVKWHTFLCTREYRTPVNYAGIWCFLVGACGFIHIFT